MEPLNELFVGTVTPYSGSTTSNKNAKSQVMIQNIAGKMPNRNVIDGTVAERMGIEVGKTYLFNVRERGYHKIFGRDFNFTRVMEMKDSLETVRVQKELGTAEIIRIPRPDGFEEAYQRKGNVVESNIQKAIKEGLYEPVIPQSGSHKTAKEVIPGSSQEGWGPEQEAKIREGIKKGTIKLSEAKQLVSAVEPEIDEHAEVAAEGEEELYLKGKGEEKNEPEK